MKRKSLATALAASIAGIAGVASVSNAVNINPEGTGQVLLYPYYTVNNGNQTLISVVNTTIDAKAVKVRFLEGKNSHEVLDFNLYMSGFDVWTAAISPVDSMDPLSAAKITTSDTTCTVPVIPADGEAFRNYQYGSGSSADEGDPSLARTREGHLEMIEMGVLTASDLDAGLGTSPHGSGVASTHNNVAGIVAPASCAQLIAAWSTGSGSVINYWQSDNTDNDITTPTGGLFGAAAIVNAGRGTLFSYNAEAVDNFFRNSLGSLHTQPGSLDPSLFSSVDTTDINDAGFGGTFRSVIFRSSNGDVQVDHWATENEAMSAVLMQRSVMNEYIVAEGFKTEWVVNFPTKNPFVNQLVGAVDPFTVVWNRPGDGSLSVGACEPIDFDLFDREEQRPGILTGGPIFSPPCPDFDGESCPTGQGPALCWEAQVITFNNSLQPNNTGTPDDDPMNGPSDIFGSYNYADINLNALDNFNVEAGWMKMSFNGNELNNHEIGPSFGSANSGPSIFGGLPVIGFMAYEIDVTDLATPGGFLANYAGLWKHRGEREVTFVSPGR